MNILYSRGKPAIQTALIHSLLSSDSFKILALHRLTFRLYLTDSCAGSMGTPNFHRIWWRYQLVSFLC